MMERNEKILFYLTQDENGYPPEEVETMWATSLGNDYYKLNNIPFYAMGISDGDIIQAEKIGDELRFVCLIEPSKNCTIRILILNLNEEEDIRSSLRELGCSIEGTGIEGLIAVSFHRAKYNAVRKYLHKALNENILDYQESALR